jgi:hypothetical protein
MYNPRAVRTLSSIAWLVLFACATNAEFTRLPDGSYRVVCQRKLDECLEPVEELCKVHGYDVAWASERRDRAGPSGWENTSVNSAAVVRCRQGQPLLGGSQEPLPLALASATPAPQTREVVAAPATSAPLRCVPGASQPCALTRDCVGVQVCGADGTLQPCDCSWSTTTPPRSNAAPASDAGAP